MSFRDLSEGQRKTTINFSQKTECWIVIPQIHSKVANLLTNVFDCVSIHFLPNSLICKVVIFPDRKFYMHLSFLPSVPHAPLQSFSLVLITLTLSHYVNTLRGFALQNIAIPCLFPPWFKYSQTHCYQTCLNVKQAYKHLHDRNRISRCLGHVSGITTTN